uniref:30S ribosomal protein S31, chloroplastic n=1 Tax=Oryza nivara TaxID=4536 RepID=A0A0E0HAI5_ORYNI
MALLAVHAMAASPATFPSSHHHAAVSSYCALPATAAFSRSRSRVAAAAAATLSAPLTPVLEVYCGRGDKKTKRGKRFNHSYGNARPRNKKKGTGPARLFAPPAPPRKDQFDDGECLCKFVNLLGIFRNRGFTIAKTPLLLIPERGGGGGGNRSCCRGRRRERSSPATESATAAPTLRKTTRKSSLLRPPPPPSPATLGISLFTSPHHHLLPKNPPHADCSNQPAMEGTQVISPTLITKKKKIIKKIQTFEQEIETFFLTARRLWPRT